MFSPRAHIVIPVLAFVQLVEFLSCQLKLGFENAHYGRLSVTSM